MIYDAKIQDGGQNMVNHYYRLTTHSTPFSCRPIVAIIRHHRECFHIYCTFDVGKIHLTCHIPIFKMVAMKTRRIS